MEIITEQRIISKKKTLYPVEKKNISQQQTMHLLLLNIRRGPEVYCLPSPTTDPI